MGAIDSAERCKAIIAQAFHPKVAVYASEDTEEFVKNLDVPDLLSLLKPYGALESVTVRNLQSMSKKYSDFLVSFCAPNDLGSSLSVDDLESLLKKHLQGERDDPYLFYYNWLRDMLVKNTSSVPFETFQHPATGIIAISSKAENPIETLTKLYQKSHNSGGLEYVNVDFLRYFVLIHDEGDNIEESQRVFDQIKRQFGPNCDMLRLGSSQPSINDKNIAEFTYKMVSQSVIPFMEKVCALWNEQVSQSRQSLAGRLFGASRRYLTSPTKVNMNILETAVMATQKVSIPVDHPPPSAAANMKGDYNMDRKYYHYLASEAQLRKVADFAFMLREYAFAYSIYDLLKKDYHNDKAWEYLASCQEIACISYLMTADTLPLRTANSVIDPLLDSSVYTYTSRCNKPEYALRCILLSSELLCTVPTDTAASQCATKWLLKAMNDRLVGHLAYSMLMERMGNAFLVFDELQVSGLHSRSRKASFWLLLAAREWQEADFNEESQRCVQRSMAISYEKLAWAQKPEFLLGRLQRLNNK